MTTCTQEHTWPLFQGDPIKTCIGASLLLHITALVLFGLFGAQAFNRATTEKICFVDLQHLPQTVPASAQNAAPRRADQPQPAVTPRQQIAPTVQPTTSTPTQSSVSAQTANTASAASNSVQTGVRQTTSTSTSDVAFGSASGPSFLHREAPAYPHIARRFGREGKVLLRLTINESGSLANVEILEDPGHGFASAAIEALRKSRFKPAIRNGTPVLAKAILPVRFTLQATN